MVFRERQRHAGDDGRRALRQSRADDSNRPDSTRSGFRKILRFCRPIH